MQDYKFLIAAGGTGGHLFPAIAVVEELQSISKNFEFHFCGRKDKIEGKVVPSIGYEFHPIDIIGLKGLFSLNNLVLPFKIIQNERRVKQIIKEHKINAVIATGAYISYPPSKAAVKSGIPLFLMESNYNVGKTISLLAKHSKILFTSFPETEEILKNKNVSKIVYSGNPVRKSFYTEITKEEARKKIGLKPNKPVVLIFGGSLGARVINAAVEKILPELIKRDIQLIWQTGENYNFSNNQFSNSEVLILKFIEDMSTAYKAADVVVSRSGASTMSELSIMRKASILVPLTTASNNEQEQNANFFVKNNAALIINQNQLDELLLKQILDLFENPKKIRKLEENISLFAKPDAAKTIAGEILNVLSQY